jgi:adenosylmethionine-8-amino-7-oxononanoate aminotransferase
LDAERSRAYPLIAGTWGTPFAVERAEGATLITPDGRRILDAAGGAVVVNIGHGRREPVEAYQQAVSKVAYLVPPFVTEDRIQLVERLREHWLPEELTRVLFTSGGSESMDSAIRLARQHFVSAGQPRRWKVIGRDMSYHGATLATLAIGGHTKRRTPFEPWLADLPRAPACFCRRCPLGQRYPQCGVACAEELDRVIELADPETVAAFVAEPIVGSAGGAVVPPDEYWPRIAEICRARGILLIADEVMTGFGRTGQRFALDHWGVVPDILAAGKGLTGGYAPMGALFAREQVVAPIAAAGDELMAFTYSAHPGACAAANAVLEILQRENLLERVVTMGERLGRRLERLRDHPNVFDVRGRGLLFGVELVKDRDTGEPFPAEVGLTSKVVAAGLASGVFFYPGGTDPARDVMVLGPPFIIDEDDVERIGSVLEHSISSAVERASARLNERG